MQSVPGLHSFLSYLFHNSKLISLILLQIMRLIQYLSYLTLECVHLLNQHLRLSPLLRQLFVECLLLSILRSNRLLNLTKHLPQLLVHLSALILVQTFVMDLNSVMVGSQDVWWVHLSSSTEPSLFAASPLFALRPFSRHIR